MKLRIPAIAVIGVVLLAVSGSAQTPAAPPPNPLDVVPDKMPFDIPYGAPISLAKAKKLIEAVEAETRKRGWAMNVAVVDAGGNLVAFDRMDGAQLASITIAQHKARVAARFRRETKVFEDAVQKGTIYMLTLDDVIASRGGFPLIENGTVIGAIGCSGGAASQDAVACAVGAALVK
ncbi:MAG: heme-binding protein [Rhizomicrobium sp.]